jgi:hypothetical protein
MTSSTISPYICLLGIVVEHNNAKYKTTMPSKQITLHYQASRIISAPEAAHRILEY